MTDDEQLPTRRRFLAVVAILAVLIAGVVVINTDPSSRNLSALPGATAQPPTGPTGGGPGGGVGGPPFPIQSPGMPDGPGAYNSGAYPPPGQSGYGIDINSSAEQAPSGSQNGNPAEQNFPQQTQPANGTQPPDYDAPIRSAPSPSPSPQQPTGRPQQPEQTQTTQQGEQHDQEHEQPEAKQDNRECTDAPQSISAVRNGQVVYSSTSQYGRAVSSAAASWNKLANVVISPSQGGQTPTLVIKDVDQPNAKWRGQYERPQGDQPAQISINTAFLKDASPQLIQSLIAHELGHALGLLDSTSEASLMGSLAAGPEPTAVDAAALTQANASGAACTDAEPSPAKYNCLFGGQNADGSCSALNDLRGEDKYGRRLGPSPGPEWLYQNDSNPEIAEPTDTKACEAGTRDPRCGGIVRVCYPKNLPSIPDDMVKERAIYIEGSNLFVQDNAGQVVRRTTQGVKDLEAQRRSDVAAAKKANEALFRGKDVGHVPDIVWQGLKWIDARMVFPMTTSLNRSIGAQAGAYPVGYVATAFVPGKWVNDQCVPE